MKKINIFLVVSLILVVTISYASNKKISSKIEKIKKEHKKSEEDVNNIQVPPPPFSEDIYPCSQCHSEIETNPKRRKLEDMHDDIVLKHDEKNRWCLDCHNADNRDYLHLASGKLVDFKESYKLCGQCHGPKYRDWKAGVHGKRTGYWNGKKQYLLCVHCHSPHSPRFKKIKPLPPPKRPENIK